MAQITRVVAHIVALSMWTNSAWEGGGGGGAAGKVKIGGMLAICEAGNIPALFYPSFLHLASPPSSFHPPSPSLPPLTPCPSHPPHPIPPPMCKPACPPVGSSSWSVHSVSAAAETGSQCSWNMTPAHGRHLTRETMPQCLAGTQGEA